MKFVRDYYGLALLLLAIVYGAWGAVEAEKSRLQRDWIKCGKPWGEPCRCPGTCQCGIKAGYSCGNCRPMRGE